jgi:hypothetical protein
VVMRGEIGHLEYALTALTCVLGQECFVDQVGEPRWCVCGTSRPAFVIKPSALAQAECSETSCLM